jgi:hypothetical protein
MVLTDAMVPLPLTVSLVLVARILVPRIGVEERLSTHKVKLPKTTNLVAT